MAGNCADETQSVIILKAMLKKKLTAEEMGEVDDQTVARFYRATGRDRDLTVKRLVATAKWRQKERPECKVCAACTKTQAHWMHTVGHDRTERPILFTSYIMIEDAGAESTTEHMLVEFERAVRLMPPGVESWVWIMDFRGYGRRLGDLNPTLAKNFLRLSQTHYPERLGQLWVVDAPSLVNPLWNMLKPLIDPVTHAKFQFLPWDLPPGGDLPPYIHPTDATHSAESALKSLNLEEAQQVAAAAPVVQETGGKRSAPSKLWAKLCDLCDQEMAEWVVTEISRIRAWDDEEEGVDAPVYDVQALCQAVAAQEVAALPRQPGGHCHYGTPSLLQFMQDNPNALQPSK